jgi:hypothetical protein
MGMPGGCVAAAGRERCRSVDGRLQSELDAADAYRKWEQATAVCSPT